jgi:ribosomal-protein-alanine N-acetyltransferase
MSHADVDAIAAIEATLCEFPWTRANFLDALAVGYSTWVCRLGQALVGYAVMMLVVDEAHLLNIGIHGDWQHRGYGSQLLEYLALAARRGGATSMFLEVRPSNEAGCALYRSGGFHAIGLRRGYYPAAAGRENALVLKRAL